MPTKKIDTNWFKNRLRDIEMSQKEFARQMGMDPAAISLALRAKRKILITEAVSMAKILRVSVDEVLERAGLDLRGVGREVEPGSRGPAFRYCPHCGHRLE